MGWNQCRFAKEDDLTRQRREESERQRKLEQFNRRAMAREDCRARELRSWGTKCKHRVAEVESLLQKWETWKSHRVRATQKEERRRQSMTAQAKRDALKAARSAARQGLLLQRERRALLRRKMRQDVTMDEILGP